MFMSDQNYRTRVPFYIGADGKRVTLADLPSGTHRRWLPRHKQIVLSAVCHGLLTFEEACERYKLTVDEFLSWQRSIDKHGLPGLRATRIQDYRG